MQAFLMRMRNQHNSTYIVSMFAMITDNHTTRYTQEETLMHEDVMKMVPTFKDVVMKLGEDPVHLESFIAYVCMRIYASQIISNSVSC
jgi:hypothetical protein